MKIQQLHFDLLQQEEIYGPEIQSSEMNYLNSNKQYMNADE